MFLQHTLTKKVLENLIYTHFLQTNQISVSKFLDKLKYLGFNAATNSGISIGLEELQTPAFKQLQLYHVKKLTLAKNLQYKLGAISEPERFISIINNWQDLTEIFKTKIIRYYQQFNPLNNLYIMAFSGARGNILQLLQLVGLRGLMLDQNSQIIPVPIQSNFQEGLSSMDYVISAYGARKGVIDTALKTADAGYLTRRLIFLAQHIIIRDYDCNTKQEITILFTKTTSVQTLLGYTSPIQKALEYPYKTLTKSQFVFLDHATLKGFQTWDPFLLKLRSPLTCQTSKSLCQICYGQNLTTFNTLIPLGETVGVLAAQSIGEPGTQLTMRTFHTGGVFTGKTSQKLILPQSGKLLPVFTGSECKIRTEEGTSVYWIKQNLPIWILHWNGKRTEFVLPSESYFYYNSTQFYKMGDPIGARLNSTDYSIPQFHPLTTPTEGRLRFKVLPHLLNRDRNPEYFTYEKMSTTFSPGKNFKYSRTFQLNHRGKNTPSSVTAKLITVETGILISITTFILLFLKNQKLKINLATLNYTFAFAAPLAIIPLIKTFQYVDAYTILAIIQVSLPNVKQKLTPLYQHVTTSLYTTICSNITLVNYTDELFHNVKKKAEQRNLPTPYHVTLIHHNGSIFTYQYILNLCIAKDTLILNFSNSAVLLTLKHSFFGALILFKRINEENIQGLPKIDTLLENTLSLPNSILNKTPGVLLSKVLLTPTLDHTYLNWKTFRKISINTLQINEPILDDDEFEEDEEDLRSSSALASEIENEEEDFLNDEEIDLFLSKNSYSNKNLKHVNNLLIRITSYYFPSLPLLELITLLYQEYCAETMILLPTERQAFLLPSADIEITSDDLELAYTLTDTILNLQQALQLTQIYALPSVSTELIDKFLGFTLSKKIVVIEIFNYPNLQTYPMPTPIGEAYPLGSFINIGKSFTFEKIDGNQLFLGLFQYHVELDGLYVAYSRSLLKFNLILVNSIQAIYQSQGIQLANKHIELIVKELTRYVKILERGNTPFLNLEIIDQTYFLETYKVLNLNPENKLPEIVPCYCGISKKIQFESGFLTSISFQETMKILTHVAIEGTYDWLGGLKEQLITNKLLPIGPTFLNYKNYFDFLYSFKSLH